jgi:hypothetical protein
MPSYSVIEIAFFEILTIVFLLLKNVELELAFITAFSQMTRRCSHFMNILWKSLRFFFFFRAVFIPIWFLTPLPPIVTLLSLRLKSYRHKILDTPSPRAMTSFMDDSLTSKPICLGST